jgi:hypothetical protein
LDSSQVLVDKYEEVNVKDLEFTDPKVLIEKVNSLTDIRVKKFVKNSIKQFRGTIGFKIS